MLSEDNVLQLKLVAADDVKKCLGSVMPPDSALAWQNDAYRRSETWRAVDR